MTSPVWKQDGVSIYQGNSLDILPTLPAESVQVIVTSPAYWGLRDYGTARWEGGDQACQHEGSDRYYTENTAAVSSAGAFSEPGEANVKRLKEGRWREGGTCIKCGAHYVDAQLGLERVSDCLGWATGQPCGECYVCHTVQWAHEARRVLRDDGVMWLVLGDSYNASPGQRTEHDKAGWKQSTNRGSCETASRCDPRLKPKDLIGIPWRVALALQADGWWLRSEVIWHKPQVMPESVTDRPTRAHETVLLFSKSARYYWDKYAVLEPCQSGPSDIRKMVEQKERIGGKHKELDDPQSKASAATNIGHKRGVGSPNGRNLRSVWSIATQSYKGAHFATFPPALVEPMIKAATSEKGCCPECGAPWERIVQKPDMSQRPTRAQDAKMETDAVHISNGWAGYPKSAGQQYQEWRNENPDVTVGWRRGCSCNMAYPGVWAAEDDPCYVPYPPIPCTVLDLFGGSGTTAQVAVKLGRRAILCELNPEYVKLEIERVGKAQAQMRLF